MNALWGACYNSEITVSIRLSDGRGGGGTLNIVDQVPFWFVFAAYFTRSSNQIL
jgi:hypothetical protein